jgi:hypothetical protein
MTNLLPDDLWRDFPKTAPAFEARFASEEACRAYWIQIRWGGESACARCQSKRVWTIREGTTFECADCGHHTSLTSGTLLEKTHYPLKMQGCHWTTSNCKRWLLGTHAGAVSAKHLQAYFDEFVFRYNRRKTDGPARIGDGEVAIIRPVHGLAVAQAR